MPPTAASITSPTDPPSTAAISASLSIRISSCFEVVLLLAITLSSVRWCASSRPHCVRRYTTFSVLFPTELRNENGADLGRRRFAAAPDTAHEAEKDRSDGAGASAQSTIAKPGFRFAPSGLRKGMESSPQNGASTCPARRRESGPRISSKADAIRPHGTLHRAVVVGGPRRGEGVPARARSTRTAPGGRRHACFSGDEPKRS